MDQPHTSGAQIGRYIICPFSVGGEITQIFNSAKVYIRLTKEPPDVPAVFSEDALVSVRLRRPLILWSSSRGRQNMLPELSSSWPPATRSSCLILRLIYFTVPAPLATHPNRWDQDHR